jgi:hypothetical protein
MVARSPQACFLPPAFNSVFMKAATTPTTHLAALPGVETPKWTESADTHV